MVNIHDKRLGLIHYFVLLGVFLYIGLYVFWWQRGYYESEVAQGEVALKTKGYTYAYNASGAPVVFTAEDLIYPSIEKGALFIASSLLITNNQYRSICSDLDANCTSNADCSSIPPLQTGQCVNGYCQAMGWCPSENVTTGVSTQYNMTSLAPLTVWMKATVAFPTLDPDRFYSTVRDDVPIKTGPGKNMFSVDELLALANTNYKATSARGGIFLVHLKWECYLDTSAPCFPNVTTRRLDNSSLKSGFNFRTCTDRHARVVLCSLCSVTSLVRISF